MKTIRPLQLTIKVKKGHGIQKYAPTGLQSYKTEVVKPIFCSLQKQDKMEYMFFTYSLERYKEEIRKMFPDIDPDIDFVPINFYSFYWILNPYKIEKLGTKIGEYLTYTNIRKEYLSLAKDGFFYVAYGTGLCKVPVEIITDKIEYTVYGSQVNLVE